MLHFYVAAIQLTMVGYKSKCSYTYDWQLNHFPTVLKNTDRMKLRVMLVCLLVKIRIVSKILHKNSRTKIARKTTVFVYVSVSILSFNLLPLCFLLHLLQTCCAHKRKAFCKLITQNSIQMTSTPLNTDDTTLLEVEIVSVSHFLTAVS